MNEEQTVKLAALFSLFAVTFLFCVLPLLLTRLAKKQGSRNRRTCETVLGCLNCCGGGVFLATCLLHLFPEAKEEMEKVLEKMGYESEFPLCEFVMAFGFLLVLSTEQIVLAWKKPKVSQSQEEGRLHSDSIRTITYSMSIETDEVIVPLPSAKPERCDPSRIPIENNDHGHGHSHLPTKDPGQSALSSALLVLALSMHSVFEGLAIGLQATVQGVVGVLVAVLMHKCIIAFTLGLNLVQSNFKWKTVIVSNLIFASTSPIGIGIAMIVMGAAEGIGVKLASGVLQSLASGTFLYVTFFEVLPQELNNDKNRLLKLLCIVIGYSIMTTLIYFLPS